MLEDCKEQEDHKEVFKEEETPVSVEHVTTIRK
jgi:hypothetical protein